MGSNFHLRGRPLIELNWYFYWQQDVTKNSRPRWLILHFTAIFAGNNTQWKIFRDLLVCVIHSCTVFVAHWYIWDKSGQKMYFQSGHCQLIYQPWHVKDQFEIKGWNVIISKDRAQKTKRNRLQLQQQLQQLWKSEMLRIGPIRPYPNKELRLQLQSTLVYMMSCTVRQWFIYTQILKNKGS